MDQTAIWCSNKSYIQSPPFESNAFLLQFSYSQQNFFMKKFYAFFGILLSLHLSSFSQQGIPDVTFGTAGHVVVPMQIQTVPNTGYAIAIQSDKKIVTAGRATPTALIGPSVFLITRHNTNGTLDGTFGTGGRVYIDPVDTYNDGSQTIGYGLAIQPDGKILVVGEQVDLYDFAASQFWTGIVRLNTNGSVDNSFHTNGRVNIQMSTPVSASEGARDVVVQNDGKIVITGFATVAPIGQTMYVARLNSDGTLDNGFNGTGKVYLDFTTPSYGRSLKSQPDGKIVVVGYVQNGAA